MKEINSNQRGIISEKCLFFIAIFKIFKLTCSLIEDSFLYHLSSREGNFVNKRNKYRLATEILNDIKKKLTFTNTCFSNFNGHPIFVAIGAAVISEKCHFQNFQNLPTNYH